MAKKPKLPPCAICGGEFESLAALYQDDQGKYHWLPRYQCSVCGDTPHSPEQATAWKHKTTQEEETNG